MRANIRRACAYNGVPVDTGLVVLTWDSASLRWRLYAVRPDASEAQKVVFGLARAGVTRIKVILVAPMLENGEFVDAPGVQFPAGIANS
jgi:hypothetical protein